MNTHVAGDERRVEELISLNVLVGIAAEFLTYIISIIVIVVKIKVIQEYVIIK